MLLVLPFIDHSKKKKALIVLHLVCFLKSEKWVYKNTIFSAYYHAKLAASVV